jgi:hypothetical protein
MLLVCTKVPFSQTHSGQLRANYMRWIIAMPETMQGISGDYSLLSRQPRLGFGRVGLPLGAGFAPVPRGALLAGRARGADFVGSKLS